jgi:Zn-finger nucleic acid-binding protein
VDEQHEAAGEPLLNIPRDPSVQVDFARKRDCPRCEGIKLKRHFFSAKRQVEVDQCPNCGGYWLDAGELEKIREEKSATAGTKPGVGGTVSIEVIRYLYRVRVERQSRP